LASPSSWFHFDRPLVLRPKDEGLGTSDKPLVLWHCTVYPWSSGPRTEGRPVRCPGTKGSTQRLRGDLSTSDRAQDRFHEFTRKEEKIKKIRGNSWQRKELMKTLHVVGARPNFMKVAPITREMAAEDGRRTSRARHPQEFEQILVHTQADTDGGGVSDVAAHRFRGTETNDSAASGVPGSRRGYH